MQNKHYKVCTIGGDGVGPELIFETLRLLKSTNINFDFCKQNAGYESFKKNGTPLPKETIQTCKRSDAVLFGAVTTPPNINNYKSPIIQLRKELDLYANVRPIFSLPVKGLRQDIDLVIVRENTEGLYVGQEEKVAGGYIARRLITKKGSEKIIRFAFDLAKRQKRRTVIAVHKANVLRKTDGLFLKTAQEVAKNYDNVDLEDMLVDATAMRLIKEPDRFDVIVTTNMFGDILSDEAAMLVGGLGVVASGNVGKDHALFEPVHGSAPKYAGKNSANPTACFLASCMMLEFLGEKRIAKKIRDAIVKTIELGCMTQDLGGNATTTKVTDEVISQYLRSHPDQPLAEKDLACQRVKKTIC